MKKFLDFAFPFVIIMVVLVLFLQSCSNSTSDHPNGSIKVDSVYTTDAYQKDKTAFGRGDLINYDVKVDNTMSSQLSLNIHVHVFATAYNQFVSSHLYTYDHITTIRSVKQGVSILQTATSIPSDAAPAIYEIQITVMPGNTSFAAKSEESRFTIQPPAQLGPFTTGTFTRDDGHVQGTAQLTITKNGNYIFSGCIENLSSILGYSDVFSWGIVSASGTLYKFDHTGGISGKWQGLDRINIRIVGSQVAQTSLWQTIGSLSLFK